MAGKCKFQLVDVDLYYNDEPDIIRSYLCAVGEFDDNEVCDEYDSQIFYWFSDMDELETFKKNHPKSVSNREDFTVLSYENLREAKL